MIYSTALECSTIPHTRDRARICIRELEMMGMTLWEGFFFPFTLLTFSCFLVINRALFNSFSFAIIGTPSSDKRYFAAVRLPFFLYKGGESIAFQHALGFRDFDGGNIVKVEHWARFWA